MIVFDGISNSGWLLRTVWGIVRLWGHMFLHKTSEIVQYSTASRSGYSDVMVMTIVLTDHLP